MGKTFNEVSRKLFSADCPISECKEGKPLHSYVELKLYESYFNLLDKFAEFKPQVDAITRGHKAWSSEFEIDGKKYTVKALDNSVAHNFNDACSASFSAVYLPEGYVRVETDDGNEEFFQFSEFYEKMRKTPEQLEKFDEAFVKAQKIDITDEYFSDLRVILANTLSPIHAAAKDSESFNQLLNIIGTYHPKINNFLQQTYNSSIGLSQLLEHQAKLSLEEKAAKKIARPETLEDVLETGILAKVANAIKRASTTVPGLLVATASGAVAAHSDSGSHDSADNHIASKETGQKYLSDNTWENTSAQNPPKTVLEKFPWFSVNYFGATYIEKRNEIFWLQYDESGSHDISSVFETWIYHPDTNTWENKTTTAQQPSALGSYETGELSIAYDSKNDKVVFVESPNAWYGNHTLETWVYDCPTNTWENKTTGLEPGIRGNPNLAYDENSGKIIAYPNLNSNNALYVYDCALNKWEGRTGSPNQPSYSSFGDPIKDFFAYIPKERKALYIAENGQWLYDEANNKWDKKSDPPAFSPHINGTDYGGHSWAYDSQSDKVISLILRGAASYPVYETWIYDIDKNSWSDMKAVNNPKINTYTNFKLIYDSKNDKVYSVLQPDQKIWHRFELWQYSLSTPAKTATSPTFVISDAEKLAQGTPQQLSYPQSGDDSAVANNHANGQTDQQQFTDAGTPIIFYNEKVGSDGYLYKEYFLYYTDNPAYVIAPGFKDHHAHDWEAVVDKCTLDGNVVERATSYHVKLSSGQLERCWKFTNDASKPVYIELAGHAMSTDSSDFANPFDLVAKDPQNNEDLHPAFYHRDGKTLTPGNYTLVTLDKIINDSQLDTSDRYNADGYPSAASAYLGDAAKVPWKSTALVSPWSIFENKDKGEAKSWQNYIEGQNIEARLVQKGSRLVLGEENGTQKADIPGTYVKSGNNIFLASDFTSYNDVQLEVSGKDGTHYKITMHVTKNVNGQSVSEEKVFEKDIKKDETHIIKLNTTSLTPDLIPGGDNGNGTAGTNPNDSMTLTLIGAGAAGITAAAGVAYVLYNRRRRPPAPTTLPSPQQQQYAYSQQFTYTPQYDPQSQDDYTPQQ